MTFTHHSDIDDWAYKNFSNVQLFDKRRTKRLVSIAAGLAKNQGQSLACIFDSWYDTKATYNLINHDFMTPDTIQHEHRQLTITNIINWEGDVLAIEDSSEFEWNGLNPIEGLGPIGSGRENDQGFILHSTLAVGVVNKKNTCSRSLTQVLGLPYQQYYVRPSTRVKSKKRSTTNEKIETDLWRQVIKNEIFPKEVCNKIIRVCDRGADIYEVINETADYGCNYIIRVKHDRAFNDHEHDRFENKLFQNMRELPSIGETSIERRGREGTKKRTIPLQVNWQSVSLRAPARPGFGIGRLPPLEATVVHVWGIDSETDELIEWFLYTNLPINSLEEAIKIIQYYAARWIIEDYHKAIKSGLKAEKLQLETAHGLFAAIAIMSVVALRLVDLREALRINPEAPANESGLSALEIKVLETYLKRKITTVKCVVLAIGRLGGHLNRKSDGMPGLMTLWLGMNRFLNIVEGVKLMQSINI